MNDIQATDQESLPPHLIRSAGADWAFWKIVQLRSAGFPAERVLRLSFPACTTAEEQLRVAEQKFGEASDKALQEVNRKLAELRENQDSDDGQQTKPLLNTRRAIVKRKLAKVARYCEEITDPAIGEALRELLAAEAPVETCLSAFREAYDAAVTQQSEELRQMLSDDRFQEAMIWQNRSAFKRTMKKLAGSSRPAAPRNHKQRRSEELIANYLQRYCVKNDTIGFFGPTGWCRFVDDHESLDMRPGSELLATRRVFLEDWTINELAKALVAQEPGLRRWLSPQIMPAVGFHEGILYLPRQKPTPLTPDMAALLQACRGEKTAQDLAQAVNLPGEDNSEEDIYRKLAELSDMGAIRWSFEVPIKPDAGDALRSQIEEVGEESLRRRCTAALDELEGAQATISQAAGDSRRLEHALRELEETFMRLTGQAATRRAGTTYGARTLAYEDSVRDVALDLGTDVHQAIAEPLSLLMQSVRWFMFHTAEHLQGLFREVYEDLAKQSPMPFVAFGYFWQRIEPILRDEKQNLICARAPEMGQRWQQILAVDPEQRRVEFTSAELKEKVAEAFAVESSGWQTASYHSPDIMIAASSAEAIRNGDYHIVLGEFHLANNTVNGWGFMALSPHQEEINQSIEFDQPEPRVIPMAPREPLRITARTNRAWISPKDFLMPPPDGAYDVPPKQAVVLRDLVVEDTDTGLVVRSHDHSVRLDILTFLSELIQVRLADAFTMVTGDGHRPRVTIDRMIVQRESWRFPVAELPFADCREDSERYRLARRWARDHDLPRFVFIRTPVEVKPFYIDLESPIYIDCLAKAVTDMSEKLEDASIAVTEMVPDPSQAWLEDAAGQRYTSELRTVLIDPAGGSGVAN